MKDVTNVSNGQDDYSTRVVSGNVASSTSVQIASTLSLISEVTVRTTFTFASEPPSRPSSTQANTSTSTTIMFKQWDLVQPRVWFPMSSLEQSLMELNPTSAALRESDKTPTAPAGMNFSDLDDDFFRDLPRGGEASSTPDQQSSLKGANGDARAFSSYAFSSSTTVDDHGRRVSSTRRRYEDSTGRLKAVHERDVDGVKLRTLWHRQDFKDRDGSLRTTCSSGTPEDFEALWMSTPFGEVQHRAVTLTTKPGDDGKNP